MLAFLVHAELPAQAPDPDVEPIVMTRNLVIHAGLSRFVGDLGESEYGGFGPAVRAGLVLSSSSTLGVAVTHWPSVGDFRRTALQLEVLQRLSPSDAALGFRLGMAVGRTWSSLVEGDGDVPDGTSAAFGLGAEIGVSSSTMVEAEFRVRTDRQGWNGEWRAMAGYVVGDPQSAGSRPRPGLTTYWMIPVRGPWELVSPAFGLRTRRRLDERFDAGLALSLLHWRIPDETRARGYAWDTRALLASIRAGWKASTYPGLGIRLGPLIAAMGEGPDNGANFGGTAEISFGARLGEFPLEAAIGWLWIARSDSRDPGDQHGLTLSLTLGS